MLAPFDRSQYRPATADELHARKQSYQAVRLAVANGYPAQTGNVGRPQSDAGTVKLPAHQLPAQNATAADLTSIVLRRVADVEAVPIRWLWPGRIARGKLTMI